MNGSLQARTCMTLLSAVCEALPEVVAGGIEPGASRAGLSGLLDLMLRAIAAAGAPGAMLLLRLPGILSRANYQLLDAPQVTAPGFDSPRSYLALMPACLNLPS